jgi:hypothetical protein
MKQKCLFIFLANHNILPLYTLTIPILSCLCRVLLINFSSIKSYNGLALNRLSWNIAPSTTPKSQFSYEPYSASSYQKASKKDFKLSILFLLNASTAYISSPGLN